MTLHTGFACRQSPAHLDFLVETVAGALHLQAVEVVTIAACVSAALRTQDQTLLRAHRNLLADNARPTPPVLKYGAEIGLSGALVARLDEACADFADGKRALAALAAPHAAAPPHSQLQAHALRWRRAAAEMGTAMDLFDESARHSLNVVYGQDTQAVRQALQKAADGDQRLLDRFGRLVAPALRQRRQSPRLIVRRSAALHLPTGVVSAWIEDISRDSLGVFCTQPLISGQRLTFTLADGPPREAVVAAVRDGVFVLSLRTRLSEREILSAAAW